MNNIDQVRENYNRVHAERKRVQDSLLMASNEVMELERGEEKLRKVRWVFTEVASQTQTSFKNRVEGLITMAINAVFDRPFEFKLKFEEKAGRSVCIPTIVENGLEYIPKDDLGGGIIDVISFAFRVTLWSLQNPRSRNLFALDEPMKFVGKGELLMKAGNMLREISHRLETQLIIITHEPELAQIADRAYEVTHNGQISEVSKIV